MKRTREEWAARRAEIARDVAEGHTPAVVAEHWGITAARVGQIVRRVAEDERKARCARGEHGGQVTNSYLKWTARGDRRVTTVRCVDCAELLVRTEEPA
ncbi:MAG TPA: helix-turn-helix domain-containing protein [Gemmatimonadaceae bacterium]